MTEKTANRNKLFSIFIVCLLFTTSLFYVFIALADPPDDFSWKWTYDYTNIGDWFVAYTGPVSFDIDGDGIHEVFIAGATEYPGSMDDEGIIVCINGSTGVEIWNKTIDRISSSHIPISIGDLDNDGTYELIHGRRKGTTARNCEDGSIFWDIGDTGSDQRWARWHHHMILDVDGTGYPYVYIAGDDTSGQYHDYGSIWKLNGSTGAIVSQSDTFVWHPCYGGLSAADLDNDGDVEIFCTDRDFGNGPGLQWFNEDLEIQHSYGHIWCSSHCAAIADVNEDGVLDVIALHQGSSGAENGGICVIDGSTKAVMTGKDSSDLDLGCHVQPAVYDIDNDGHLELITAYATTPKVWDLVDWSLDAELGTDKPSEPPDIADVMGDSDLEIIVCAGGYGDSIYDSNYDKIADVSDHSDYGGSNVGSGSSVTQDVDGDGKNEIIFLVTASSSTNPRSGLVCYDLLVDAPSPDVRTDASFYSERRTAAAVYVPTPLYPG